MASMNRRNDYSERKTCSSAHLGFKTGFEKLNLPLKSLCTHILSFDLQVTLHTGLPIPDFYTPGEADPTGSVC